MVCSCFCMGMFDTTLYYITAACAYYFENDVCTIGSIGSIGLKGNSF